MLCGLLGAALLFVIAASLQLWLEADDVVVAHPYALPRSFAEGYSKADAGQATVGLPKREPRGIALPRGSLTWSVSREVPEEPTQRESFQASSTPLNV